MPNIYSGYSGNRSIGFYVAAEIGTCYGDADVMSRLFDVEVTYYLIGTGVADKHVCGHIFGRPGGNSRGLGSQLEPPRRRASRPAAVASNASCRLDPLVEQNRFS